MNDVWQVQWPDTKNIQKRQVVIKSFSKRDTWFVKQV